MFYDFLQYRQLSGLFWNPLRHFETESPSWRMWLSKSLSSFKVREEDTYLDDLWKSNLLVSIKRQRATRLESVHHSQENKDDAWSCTIHLISILEKGTLQEHKLRHPQMLIWTKWQKQLGCSSTCRALAREILETFSQSSQASTPIPFASSVSASRTPWKKQRGAYRCLQLQLRSSKCRTP